MTTPAQLLVLHNAVSWYLLGLAMVMQLLTYPGFSKQAQANPATWPAAHRQHTRQLGILAGGPMVLQLVLALSLLVLQPTLIHWLSCVLVALVWGLTFGVAVPAHNRLKDAFSAPIGRLLLRVNAARTALWAATAGLATWQLL